MLAKLENGNLVEVPMHFTRPDGVSISHYNLLSDEELITDGWKSVMEVQQPISEDPLIGYRMEYTETDTAITQIWVPYDIPAPPEPPEPYVPTVEEVRPGKIAESKQMLAQHLENNPLLFQGGLYNVTKDKRDLLSSQIGLAGLNMQAGVPYELTWNETGGECRVWEFAELLGLANAIDAYVKPMVSAQQKVEVQIQLAETVEAIDALMIDYERLLFTLSYQVQPELDPEEEEPIPEDTVEDPVEEPVVIEE